MLPLVAAGSAMGMTAPGTPRGRVHPSVPWGRHPGCGGDDGLKLRPPGQPRSHLHQDAPRHRVDRTISTADATNEREPRPGVGRLRPRGAIMHSVRSLAMASAALLLAAAVP